MPTLNKHPASIEYDRVIGRFMQFVNKTDDCWNWTGAILAKGYGAFRFRGGTWRANRVSYTLFKGRITEGRYVLHSCDNRRCVNPDHLFDGTQLDNITDCIAKGRLPQVKRTFHATAR